MFMTKTILQVLLIAAVSGVVWTGVRFYFSGKINDRKAARTAKSIADGVQGK